MSEWVPLQQKMKKLKELEKRYNPTDLRDKQLKAMIPQHAEIWEKWLGAIGGRDWYEGPTSDALIARSYGQALLDTMTAVRTERPCDIQTSSGHFIYEVILPRVLEHFFAKNAEYGDRHRTSKYGLPGELIGLDRKIDKLHEAIWNKKALQFEQPYEMVMDLIGQCFLMLDLMEQTEGERFRAAEEEGDDDLLG